MSFNHQQYNTQYLLNINDGGEPINDAAAYGVRIIPAQVAEGQEYWQVIGVHHLYPRENFGNHHVYLEALDANGQRVKNPPAWVGWTWEGRQPNERADPVVLDKPDYEAAGNISMHFQQTVSVWALGRSPDANEISDRVENLHTRHPDEPLEDGSLLNSVGHHSFYVVFQKRRKSTSVTKNGVIAGRVQRGSGYTVRLVKSQQVLAQQVLDQSETFRFEELAYGIYRVEVADTSVAQDNIRLDENNPEVNITLAIPLPAQSTIFGTVINGAGRTLLLLKGENIIARQVIPAFETYRFVNLAAGVYTLAVFNSSARQENIQVDGSNSREVNLVVDDETGGPEKLIPHYLLLGAPGSRGRKVNWQLAADYILTFSITAGFSVEEAKRAQRVTILGEGISQADQDAIRASGSQLELLVGDAYTIEEELRWRIETGSAFPQGRR
ncbi:MAG: hypothetical protein Kow0031_41180 [Anaerolineae bacterium]